MQKTHLCQSQEFCKTKINLTKLCPFFESDKIINTIANTHIVVI